MPVLTSEERVGTMLAGKYRIDRILGEGGWGVVFAGVHTWTDREVAIKLLHGEHSRKTDVVGRFLQEAKAAARLKHPNVVDVLDMGREEGSDSVYLVLELLRGRSLRQRLEQEGRLSVVETLEIVVPVLRALAEAHDRRIIHRDLKPDNIYLAEERGELIPKLLDFGIAKIMEGGGTATATGTVMGTPHYMSPEQVQGAATVTAAADVWSMGVVLYECLSGSLPFNGTSVAAVLVSVLTDRPPPLAGRCPAVGDRLASAVHRALERVSADRHPDARALLEDIVQAAELAGVAPARRDATGSIALAGAASTPLPLASDPVEPPTSTPVPASSDPVEPPTSTPLPGSSEWVEPPVSTPLPVVSGAALDSLPYEPPRSAFSRLALAGLAAAALALLVVAGGVVLASSGAQGEPLDEQPPVSSAEPPVEEPTSPPALPEPSPNVEPPAATPAPPGPSTERAAAAEDEHTAAPTDREPTDREPTEPRRTASRPERRPRSPALTPIVEPLPPASPPPAHEPRPASTRGTNSAPIIE